MDPETIFAAALDKAAPAERDAFLREACGDDAALRAEIDALLAAHNDAGSFLERTPEELEATASHPGEGSALEAVDADAWRGLLEPIDVPTSLGRIGGYEVAELVGRGGMGVVLRATDPKLNRVVAIKLLAPEFATSAMAVRRFLREAQAAAAVTHDHVVTIHAIDEQAQPPIIVMEYVPGKSLQQKIDAEGALDLRSILRIGMQTASGLAAAHRQGLVHRDIKPANILLENGIERVKLTDFGLARAVDDIGMTRTGQITGTPQYMSPEQAQGQRVDHRTDLFSLGCVLYAMCTGRAAFRADSAVAVLHRIVHDTPRPIRELNEDVPDWLCAIVEKLLAKNAEHRFASATEVAELLGGCLAHLQQPDGLLRTEPDARAEVGVTDAGSIRHEPADVADAASVRRSNKWLWGLLFAAVPIASAAMVRSFGGFGTGEATIIGVGISMMLAMVGALVLLVLRFRVGDEPALDETARHESPRTPSFAEWVAHQSVVGKVALLMPALVPATIIGVELGLVSRTSGDELVGVAFAAAAMFLCTWGCISGLRRLLSRRPVAASDRRNGTQTAIRFAVLLLLTSALASAWTGKSPDRMTNDASRFADRMLAGWVTDGIPFEARSQNGQLAFCFDGVTLVFEGTSIHHASVGHGTLPIRGGRSLTVEMAGRGVKVASGGNALPGINTVTVNGYTFHLAERCSQLVLPLPNGGSKKFFLNELQRPLVIYIDRDGTHLRTSHTAETDATDDRGTTVVPQGPKQASSAKLDRTWQVNDWPIVDLDISDDGQWLVSAHRSPDEHQIWMWPLDQNTDEKRTWFPKVAGGEIRDLKISPDSTRVAWVEADGRLQVRELSRDTLSPAEFDQAPFAMHCLTWSPDGTRLVVGSGGVLTFWDARTGGSPTVFAEIPGAPGPRVTSLAREPRGQRIAAGTDNGQVVVWELREDVPHLVREFQVPHNSRVWSLSWSAERRWLVAGLADGSVEAIEFNGTRRLNTGHQAWPTRLIAVSPDGRWVASAGESGPQGHSIHIVPFDGVTQQRPPDSRRLLNAHSEPITGLVFTPDGRYLISASEDGTVKRWRFNTRLSSR